MTRADNTDRDAAVQAFSDQPGISGANVGYRALLISGFGAGWDACAAQFAERAAVLSETAFLTHEMGTPGEGPFTNGQRYADEARVQIAALIRSRLAE